MAKSSTTCAVPSMGDLETDGQDIGAPIRVVGREE